uniref:Uncharacterized protein n=1 Tax=Mucochytrium quahogii TaxID=96639 RepID=A0A7S2SGA4_9STRA|mmetsp:Transcript_1105/g.1801  ORF Transcript_1105/g.1801 Transcript_1105/m.1801 type:complete len:207 (+) Transcript_1105:5255-5875(+)|eukprot:CAMPEP_0203778320 /NCGR_PEP_ID=MMETSP0099_2-20121227/7927_1 /ASSEMBLY_ACC=CAM_ASM_000209 /TAXON_ID=96639 /ORGANISM=" , Strain NY0313808BC1" /LENGTH=206 /DNA_ID=CAMNT_0050677807 /DNA_START=15 /DNA_END=635 /DNA_ORIENTATION=+
MRTSALIAASLVGLTQGLSQEPVGTTLPLKFTWDLQDEAPTFDLVFSATQKWVKKVPCINEITTHQDGSKSKGAMTMKINFNKTKCPLKKSLFKRFTRHLDHKPGHSLYISDKNQEIGHSLRFYIPFSIKDAGIDTTPLRYWLGLSGDNDFVIGIDKNSVRVPHPNPESKSCFTTNFTTIDCSWGDWGEVLMNYENGTVQIGSYTA